LNERLRLAAAALIVASWGSPVIVSRGRVHRADCLPGFAAVTGDTLQGLITYRIENGECEIVSLDSILEGQGIGTALVEAVLKGARAAACRRVWLITTNDNTKAIRFWQKRGFDLAGIHLEAIREARKSKPEIPEYGCDGIPIRHEIEMEKMIIKGIEK